MQVHHLTKTDSIAGKFVAQLRDISIQNDRLRFRRNIERLGEILGYELSKTLSFSEKQIQTPLGKSIQFLPDDEIVICSILRAGLPLHQGLLNYFDDAENSFISAYRHHPNNDEQFEILVEYLASPSLEGKTLILADPMLATGRSFVNVYKALQKMGTPETIHLVSIIGSEEGIEYLEKELPEKTQLWIAAVDGKLDKNGYIVPGLGDAGDLCFGNKLQH
ncbi:uracil phosphoribosyltransferase [Christiangramia flava]|uniref:Uracil phosphoribosyltransferase n=1 Tax=Christiangramia flava JLT2011 TaxID=1229726 RepID=A0A1L7I9W3_9FLAO|nr:uracil phosphoribosyltransferase [Christiangramia flava]APU69983.1 phosphoribosyltransferase [Christiangramia flava JLT2011]OSS39468.1 uracil phosphoribosyltransferase [Christiangramia flava JLT2011]